MIPRYSREKMRSIWTEEAKFSHWLEIETLACDAMAKLGHIPKKDATTIRSKAKFDIKKIAEIEKRTQHDVLAFLENVASYVGPAGRWIHQGLTSSDILDTTLALQLRAAADILIEDLQKVRKAIAAKAKKYKEVPMIGRSHGVHAEPITYGLKMALMYEEFGRAEERMIEARKQIAVGKLSGAVGTYAHIDPRVEVLVCKALNLEPAKISTQVIQRDRHAHYFNALALVASSIERWAMEFRLLQRTEVLEVEEFFAEGQKGSSAMPHKRNPVVGERLCGLARVVRANSIAAMENVALWHERDISHSSVERVIGPDSTIALDYMLGKLEDLVAKQFVYPQNMLQNLALTKGLYFSQSILLALTDRGVERQKAYELVQRNAMAAWSGRGTLLGCLIADPEVLSYLSATDLKKICSLDRHFRHIDYIFTKCGLS